MQPCSTCGRQWPPYLRVCPLDSSQLGHVENAPPKAADAEAKSVVAHDSYESGYAKGYAAGYAEGHAAGYAKGKNNVGFSDTTPAGDPLENKVRDRKSIEVAIPSPPPFVVHDANEFQDDGETSLVDSRRRSPRPPPAPLNLDSMPELEASEFDRVSTVPPRLSVPANRPVTEDFPAPRSRTQPRAAYNTKSRKRSHMGHLLTDRSVQKLLLTSAGLVVVVVALCIVTFKKAPASRPTVTSGAAQPQLSQVPTAPAPAAVAPAPAAVAPAPEAPAPTAAAAANSDTAQILKQARAGKHQHSKRKAAKGGAGKPAQDDKFANPF